MSDEEAFRSLLDARGILRRDAMAPLDRAGAFMVFAQRPDARLDVASLDQQGSRFFGAKLGLTVDKRYGGETLEVDAARMVVATDDPASSGTRLVYGRPAGPDDLLAAADAERVQNTHGMALLAERCPTVWLVAAESPDDRAALTIAAVFASVMLGPIVPPGGRQIYGVRGARLALERPTSAYR